MTHSALPRLACSTFIAIALVGCGGGGSSSEPQLPDNTFDLNLVDSTDLTGFWLLTSNIVDQTPPLAASPQQETAAITLRSSLIITHHDANSIIISDAHLSCNSSYTIQQNSTTPIDITANSIQLNDNSGFFNVYQINTTGELNGIVVDNDNTQVGTTTLYKLSNNTNAEFGSINSLYSSAGSIKETESIKPSCFQELSYKQTESSTFAPTTDIKVIAFGSHDPIYIVKMLKIVDHVPLYNNSQKNSVAGSNLSILKGTNGVAESTNAGGNIATQNIISKPQSIDLELELKDINIPEDGLITIKAGFDLTTIK